MLLCACAYDVKSEISQVRNFAWQGDSASNAVAKRSVLSAFINQRCAESACLYYGLRVCEQKYIGIRLYVTVCEKVVPRLNKHNDVIEWNFMKIAPPEMKSWLHPCPQQHSLQLQKRSARMSLWIRAVESRRCAPGIIGVREGISLGGRKKYVLKITIYPETNFFSRIRMKPETSCKSVLYSWMRL